MLTHPTFVLLYCSFFMTYNVTSSSFFFNLVPKILNCIWLPDLSALLFFSRTRFLPIYDVIYQVVCVWFLSLNQTYRGATSNFAQPAAPPLSSCASPNVPVLVFVNVPCIKTDVLYLNVSLLNVTLLASFYLHVKVT